MFRARSALFATAVVFALAASIAAEASHLTENPRRHKIVYHLTEPGADKAKAVLGNIRNHVKGVGGWQTLWKTLQDGFDKASGSIQLSGELRAKIYNYYRGGTGGWQNRVKRVFRRELPHLFAP